jgi:hypothetical protein
MSNFSVGDFVRIDFGSYQDREHVRGVFVHPSMRVLQGQTYKVGSVDDVYGHSKYRLVDANGLPLSWTFQPEWLCASDEGSVTASEIERTECYDGIMWPSDMCVQLTEPSPHAGSYARRFEVTRCIIGGNEIFVLDVERDEVLIEISGSWELLSEVSEDDYVCCDGGSCEGEYIWRDNSVYVEGEGYYHEDDQGRYFWWHEGPDEYRTYEPEDEGDTLSYHAQQNDGYISRTNAGTLYTIGFEVEKEDGDVLSEYDTNDTRALGWSREHDGSLNDEIGYELVSPIYDLFDDKLDSEIAASSVLRDHINADSTTACGGHVNFGKVGTRGSQLLKECAAFLPLFMALYRKRATSRWSRIDMDMSGYDGGDRYVAFNVKEEYIEFRIIARVHDVDTLLWRRDLFRIMASNPNAGAAKVQQMMLDRRSELHKHLRKMYTEDKLLRLVCWYSQFADAMFDTLQFSKTGHGVMMDFFIGSLRRTKKRFSVGISDVTGWVDDVHQILSNARNGGKYTDKVRKVSDNSLKFLEVKG